MHNASVYSTAPFLFQKDLFMAKYIYMQNCKVSSCKLCKDSLFFSDPRPRAKQERGH